VVEKEELPPWQVALLKRIFSTILLGTVNGIMKKGGK
jgi:hypothetical protein